MVKAFFRPFLVTFFVVMFILLMFFLFKWVDDLIGKGLEWYTILELMMYASATYVSMALPLSVLLSSIMTFGTLGENYELVAIKSAGVSLQKAMRPLFLLIILLSVACLLFSNFMLPKANMKFGSLLYDIRNKKLSFLIKPGVFNNSIQGYAMRIDRKSEGATDSLYGITIYDHTSGNVPKIVLAQKGEMKKTADNKYLVLQLENGVRYEEGSANNGIYNPRQTFTRMKFKKTEVKFDLSSFSEMSKTRPEDFKNNVPMLNLKELVFRKDSMVKSLDTLNQVTKVTAGSYFKQQTLAKGYMSVKVPPKQIKGSIINAIPQSQRIPVLQSAFDQAASIKQTLEGRLVDYDFKRMEIIKAQVEYQRKYTLAGSCLLLFFIGAPLGAIIRKGGLGLPVVVAVIFFMIYHIISTIAEKSAKEGSLDPVFGMWLAIIVLAPLGIFLTYKATVDSALFDLDYYKQLVVRVFKKKEAK